MLLAAVTQTTGIIVARSMTTIEATKAIMMNTNTMVTTTMIDAIISLVAKRRTSRKSPKRREMTANAITSWRMKRSCKITTALLWTQTLHSEKGVAPCQGLLLAHVHVLALAQAVAKGAMQIIMMLMMTASKVVPSSTSICTRTTTTDKFTVQNERTVSLPPLSL